MYIVPSVEQNNLFCSLCMYVTECKEGSEGKKLTIESTRRLKSVTARNCRLEACSCGERFFLQPLQESKQVKPNFMGKTFPY
ncbi:hypothetical protein J6590_036761 [Homalodisca vitripennis]|nr:hypothetical protein J6590_036761 [Homalodisca vitripennis]